MEGVDRRPEYLERHKDIMLLSDIVHILLFKIC